MLYRNGNKTQIQNSPWTQGDFVNFNHNRLKYGRRIWSRIPSRDNQNKTTIESSRDGNSKINTWALDRGFEFVTKTLEMNPKSRILENRQKQNREEWD